jgi:hypothetical protein
VESVENSKTQKRVFLSFHRAWKSGKNKGAGFPHFHRAGGGSISLGRTKNETDNKFQLPDLGQFKNQEKDRNPHSGDDPRDFRR